MVVAHTPLMPDGVQNLIAGESLATPFLKNKVTVAFIGGLSTRQQQVLELSAQGMSREVVAEFLGLSYYTIAEHLKQAYRKLGVHMAYALGILRAGLKTLG